MDYEDMSEARRQLVRWAGIAEAVKWRRLAGAKAEARGDSAGWCIVLTAPPRHAATGGGLGRGSADARNWQLMNDKTGGSNAKP